MKYILYALIIISLIGCGGGEPSSNEEKSSLAKVSGVIIDTENNSVANANVTLSFAENEVTYEVSANEKGLYEFTNLPIEGLFTVSVIDENSRRGLSTGIVNTENPQAIVPIYIKALVGGSVSGVVINEVGEFVPKLPITLSFDETGYNQSIVTDVNGYFNLDYLPFDGVYTLFIYDPKSSSYGTYTSYLTSSNPNEENIDITIVPLENINEEIMNSDFSSGELSGWETEGDVSVVLRDTVFENNFIDQNNVSKALLKSASSGSISCVPPTYSAIASNSGSSKSIGQLSQNFIINPGQDTLVGKLKFLSDEWPTYYGSEFNDSYHLSLMTPSGTKILSKGNLNSSNWVSGSNGYSGATDSINFSVDVSSYTGKTVSLVGKVSDVGDSIVDSAIALTDVKILNKDNRNYASSGLLNGNSSASYKLGMVVWITVKNINVLGTGLTIHPTAGGTKLTPQGLLILPLSESTFRFDIFGNEPITWSFDFRTESDVLLATYEVESTWVEGMPPNPCR